ncbi:DgyrCDS11038 [Dimorphilus gyrociliatus]|uniref:DgyrCDS11038 n=1 Tax=Dimorphilus gyrociliatus TaxID=2664684 RepID=A0A7I8W4M7_9ANNE|nr:DgyrCDS11038 [Dimorphilus gyrociliatus]
MRIIRSFHFQAKKKTKKRILNKDIPKQPDWIVAVPLSKARIQTDWRKGRIGKGLTRVNCKTIKMIHTTESVSSVAELDLLLTSGKHAFAIMWPSNQYRNSNAFFSIGLSNGELDSLDGIESRFIVGRTKSSVAFDLIGKTIFHNNQIVKHYPGHMKEESCLPTLLYMYVDIDRSMLSFGCEKHFWGEALNLRLLGTKVHGFLPVLSACGVTGSVMLFYKGQFD